MSAAVYPDSWYAATRDDAPPEARALAATLRALPSARDLMRHLDFRVVPRRD